jgi:hypothetical protein
MNRIAMVVVLLVIATTSVAALVDLSVSQSGSQGAQLSTTASVVQAISNTGIRTITETTRSSGTGPAQCPLDQLSSSNASRGMTLLLCFKPGAKLGDSVDLHLIFRNDVSASTVHVGTASITITDVNGKVVFHEQVSPLNPVILSQGLSYELYTTWDTGTPLNGVAPTAGIHQVHLSINNNSDFSSETDLSLSI